MEPEKQVITLSQAKRLKELGVKQESLFYWVGIPEKIVDLEKAQKYFPYSEDITFSAFTVAELGEMLPEKLVIHGHNYWLGINRGDGYYAADYWFCQKSYNVEHGRRKWHDYAKPEMAATLATMLIHLLESNLIAKE